VTRALARPLSLLLVACFTSACGGSSGPSGGGLRGAASDAAGDAIYPDGDLVHAAVSAANDSLVLEATFLPANFPDEDLAVAFYLDLDGLGTTGDLAFDPGLGSDYSVAFYKDYPEISIARFENGAWVTQTTLTSGTDTTGSTVRARVPLALLGGDDGRMRFKLEALWWDGLSYQVSDRLTAAGQPAIQVR
jgi:hypothetical protein